jgi:hypothetical protein
MLAASSAHEGGGKTAVDFAQRGTGVAPAGFDFWRSGEGQPGEWTVNHDGTIDAPAITQLNADRTEQRYPLAVYRSLSLRNVEVSVRIRPISGRLDLAGGIAVRLRSPNDYYLVGIDAYDDEVAFFRVRDGKRDKLAGAVADISSLGWHTLDLRAEGNGFRAELDGRWLFTAYDSTFDDGKIALWTKADSIMTFTRLEITALTWSQPP